MSTQASSSTDAVRAGGPELNEAFLGAAQSLITGGMIYNSQIAATLVAAWLPEYGDSDQVQTRVYNARRELGARTDREAIRRFGLVPGASFRRLTTRGMFGVNEYSRVKIESVVQGQARGKGYRKGGRTLLQLEIDPRNIVSADAQ